MGVDYSASFGYGVALDYGEASSAVSNLIDKSILGEDVDPDNDPFEILSAHYDLVFETAGDSYSGDIYAVIGPEVYMNDEEATVTVDQEGLARLERMVEEAEITEKVSWTLAGHVW